LFDEKLRKPTQIEVEVSLPQRHILYIFYYTTAEAMQKLGWALARSRFYQYFMISFM
jgi:hypothetical protein